MPEHSAGILLYRRAASGNTIEVLLVHPGGPFWKNKDAGAWTIPKGLINPGEDPLTAARREFTEETGSPPPAGTPIKLTPVRLKSGGGKTVHAWALQGDFNPDTLKSNTFKLEWPPRSGKHIDAPEIDRAEWFTPQAAKAKINPAQAALIDELSERSAPKP